MSISAYVKSTLMPPKLTGSSAERQSNPTPNLRVRSYFLVNDPRNSPGRGSWHSHRDRRCSWARCFTHRGQLVRADPELRRARRWSNPRLAIGVGRLDSIGYVAADEDASSVRVRVLLL